MCPQINPNPSPQKTPSPIISIATLLATSVEKPRPRLINAGGWNTPKVAPPKTRWAPVTELYWHYPSCNCSVDNLNSSEHWLKFHTAAISRVAVKTFNTDPRASVGIRIWVVVKSWGRTVSKGQLDTLVLMANECWAYNNVEQFVMGALVRLHGCPVWCLSDAVRTGEETWVMLKIGNCVDFRGKCCQRLGNECDVTAGEVMGYL